MVMHEHWSGGVVRRNEIHSFLCLEIGVVSLLLDDRNSILLQIITVEELTIFHSVDVAHLISRRATGKTNLLIKMIDNSA
jgi:hypothetical protein